MNGLGRLSPFLAALMALFMLSLAGLPPGMAGLFGKFYLFSAAVRADYIGLVVIAVLNSAISVAYYLRVIVSMYFLEDAHSEGSAPRLDFAVNGVLVLCAIGIVLLGLFPDIIYGPASVAASALGAR
jgi:NADH-quinone oxidoreductase subunit N